MIGEIYNNTPKSAYKPSKEVADFTSIVKRAYSEGYENLTKPWPELNDRSVIEDMNIGQRMFNAFVDESTEDPAEAWKYRGTRSAARNKGVAMHAQLTAGFLIPSFTAQNDDDELDRDFADVMRDIIDWMVQPTNSDYQTSFYSLVIGMLESPVVYLGAEFREVYQTIKEKLAQGYSKKEVLDEVLSGFKAPVFTADQILIANPYERNIQKQRCIIERRYIEYSEAEAIYGKHENFIFVQPGVKSIMGDDGTFYDIKDDDHPYLVEEAIYKNRREDTEVAFLNGIYLGAPNVEDNPMRHRDNRNTPKYNKIPFGYYRIGQHFFYYKSMMNVLRWDNMLYDAMSELLMNRAVLEVETPIAVSGTDKIDTEVIFPNAVVAFADKDTKATPLLPPSNMAAGFNALVATKDSIDEGSLSETQTGQLPPASQKAYTVAQAQQNAKKIIAGVAKSLAESVVQYGQLMADIVINHYTAPQVDEITAGGTRLKYRKFTLEKQFMDGKQIDKEIRFDEALIGVPMTESEQNERSLKLLEEVGYPDHKKNLRAVNPHLFSKYKYLAKIDPEEMFPRNSETMQVLLTNLYTMLRSDPLVNSDKLVRELMYANFRGRGEEFIAKQPEAVPGQPMGETPQNPLGAQVQQKQLSAIADQANVV